MRFLISLSLGIDRVGGKVPPFGTSSLFPRSPRQHVAARRPCVVEVDHTVTRSVSLAKSAFNSAQGEEDTLKVCSILVRALTQTGETEPSKSEQTDDCDCQAENAALRRIASTAGILRGLRVGQSQSGINRTCAFGLPVLLLDGLPYQRGPFAAVEVRRSGQTLGKLLPETKNGEPRTIPLVAELAAILSIAKAERDLHWPSLRISGHKAESVFRRYDMTLPPRRTCSKRLESWSV